jgi:hypothetical protein
MEEFSKTLSERLIEKARKWQIPDLMGTSDKDNPSATLTDEEEALVEEKRLQFMGAVKYWTGGRFNFLRMNRQDTIGILASVHKYGTKNTARRIVYMMQKDMTPEEWALAVGTSDSDAPSKVIDAFEGAIAQVFQPHGGSENYVNLRSPGLPEGKVAATPGNSGDYPSAASTIGAPKTRAAGTGGTGFYDSSAGGVGTQSVGSPSSGRTRGLSSSEAGKQTYESDPSKVGRDSYQVGRQSRDASPQYHEYVDFPSSKIPSDPGYRQSEGAAPVKKGFFVQPNTPTSLTTNTTERIKKATHTTSRGTGIIKGMLKEEDEEGFGARVSAGVLGEEVETEEEAKRDEEEAEKMLRTANYLELQAYRRQQEGGWEDAKALRTKATDLRTKAMAKRTFYLGPRPSGTVGKAGLI